MKAIRRIAFDLINKKLEANKVLILYGPRRVGKTYLLNQFAKEKRKKKFINGESLLVQDALSVHIPEKLVSYLEGAKLLIIDEAQHIANIGQTLKLLVDSVPGLKIIVSGSASFDLIQKTSEPLVGRKKTINLYPICAEELIKHQGQDSYRANLEDHLVFGTYPEVLSLKSRDEKKEYLRELLDSYLFRDILKIENIRNPKKMRDLLTLLAFQIGGEVSLSELGNNLDIHKDTVFRYLDLLEKSFVIINIRGFSRNLRKEVSKTSRYYFYDNGIRNALINNFNPLNLRDDIGQLWENYLSIERIKKQSYLPLFSNNYFWRTYDKKEIDWLEEREGRLFAYEFKWSKKKNPKAPRDFLEAYKKEKASFKVINPDNFLEFLRVKK